MKNSIKHSIVHHFADDTNLLCSDRCEKSLKKKLNEDLKLIYTWLCANRLSLNVDKTEFIVFRPPRRKLDSRFTLKLNQKTLFESTKIKYLGMILDSSLSWKHHIFGPPPSALGTYGFAAVRSFVRSFVRYNQISKSAHQIFLIFCTKLWLMNVTEVTFSDFGEKISLSPFWAKNWPFWPKNGHFDLFFQIRSQDFASFCHRNQVFGLKKMAKNNSL